MKVSIIIPTFNKIEMLDLCLHCVLATVPGGTEIIVVDDGSTDDTGELPVFQSEPIRLLINDHNLGFALSCNRGALLARGEIIVFLNNDTMAKGGWLEKGLEPFAQEDAGIVGSKLLYPDETIQHGGIRFAPYKGHALYPCHASRLKKDDGITEPREVEAVTGACMFIRRKLFVEHGGFDKAFPAYFCDTDLCLRVRERGTRIIYQPHSILTHIESASYGLCCTHYDDAERVFFERWTDDRIRKCPPLGSLLEAGEQRGFSVTVPFL